MSSAAFTPSLQVVVPEVTALAVLFVLFSAGLVGMSIRNMFESVLSEDDEGNNTEDDIGGGLAGGEDDLDGGLAGGGDNLGGLGGLDEGDDFGGFGDEDDAFGDMGGGGGNTDELEHRLDELETEVGNLSSTVNTVRNENEQISESVNEVEENVRKLLDIYEMVTRGVNPFADDIDAGMGGLGDDGSFGLFSDDGDDDEEIDEEIVEADAEGFFDEDLVEDDDPMSAAGGSDVDDMFGNDGDAGDEFQESFDDGGDFGAFEDDEFGAFEDDETAEDDESTEGGVSFEDLKEEYDSGEADWADDIDVGEETDDQSADEDEFDDDSLADDELFDEVLTEDADEDATELDEDDGGVEVSENDENVELTAGDVVDVEGDGTDVATGEGDGTGTTESAESDATESAEADAPVDDSTDDAQTDGKPYLATLPGGFASDLIVIEWLEFMVEEAGVRETAGAIQYYETIDWISEEVAHDLQSYLRGFEAAGSGSLTIDHHTQSLKYIGQLNGDVVGISTLQHGGAFDGIQR